jgi:acyl-phosphate glycerol 3-phosphate acyltransferase
MDFLTNQNILLYLAAYLIAGIPFGYLLAKKFAGVDIKEAGSGNIGATNVLRVVKEQDPKLAKKLGAITLFLDAIKGVVVILVAKMLGAPESVLWTIAVLAVVGHCFSAFLSYRFWCTAGHDAHSCTYCYCSLVGCCQRIKDLVTLLTHRTHCLHYRILCDVS